MGDNGLVLLGVHGIKAASEMPCPCVQNLQQATGKLPVSKINLTSDLHAGHNFVKSYRTVTTQDQSQ